MIRIQGINEIKAVLAALPLDVRHPIMQATHAEAAIPLIHKAHRLAPVGRTGNLAESIGVEKPSLKRAGEVGEVRVGPKRPKGSHAHLVEYGTKDRGRTGVMPKEPFMEPAFEAEKNDVFRNIDEILGRRMIGTMRRKIKSGGGTWLQV